MKLPKSFVAVNLSDAFTFQEKQANDSEQADEAGGGDVLEMKKIAHTASASHTSVDTTSTDTTDKTVTEA